MENYIKRELYLQKLINRRDNGEVKIITGSRRCGKSWLLKKIYHDYLISVGVPPKNIISISFDIDEDVNGEDLTNPITLKQFIYSRILDEEERYYVFLDEIQMVEGFERIVNGLNARDNVDVYITGSNSRFLSSDINTIFRGRGDEVHVYPLSFKEFCTDRTEPINELWKEYYTYGGMPALRNHRTPEQKIVYLQRLWQKTYIDDVVERNHVKNRQALETLVDSLCSSIGALTNPNKIANTLLSVQKVSINADTVGLYIQYLENAFLFEGARRYNVKGKKYYESIKKYYVADVGLRNARLNFRQQELTHIMENVIYNELRIRGYLVDIGVVEQRKMVDGKSVYQQLEIDFIATNGMEKYYIQSAYALPTDEKREQELASLKKIDDSFRKIIIVGDDIATYTDSNGFTFMGLFRFLQNNDILA
ncbi:MAG: ATP-binding protein [Bacteroides sp.]|nr:ATP-binding protein [Bacteroides sp.]